MNTLVILEHQLIVRVFRASHRPEEVKGNITFVDVVAVSDVPYLSSSNCEDIIFAMISKIPEQNKDDAINYLCACFLRAVKELNIVSDKHTKMKENLSRDMLFVIVRYFANVISVPELFFPSNPEEGAWKAQLRAAQLLMIDIDAEVSFTPRMLATLVEALQDDDALKSVIEPIVSKLAYLCQTTPYLECLSLFEAFSRLFSVPAVMKCVASHPRFFVPLTRNNGALLQKQTILGCILGLSPIGDVQLTIFENAKSRDQRSLHDSMLSLQKGLQASFSSIFGLFQVLMGRDFRANTLSFLFDCISCNMERAKEQPDENLMSSDGFMVNLSYVLLKFAEPFLDATGFDAEKSKRWALMDERYVFAAYPENSRIDWRSDTRMFASTHGLSPLDIESKTVGQLSITPQNPWKFITECFFMTYRALHFGVISVISKYENRDRLIQHLESQQKKLDDQLAAMGAGANNPMVRARYEETKRRIKDMIQKEWSTKLSIDSTMFEKSLVVPITELYGVAARWLFKVYDKEIEKWEYLPEHLFEDICDYFAFIGKRGAFVLADSTFALDSVLALFVRVGEDPQNRIRNPFLRAKVADAMQVFANIPGPSAAGIWERFKSNARSTIFALLKLYHDCERTNTRSQFYDKFNFRHSISLVLAHLWGIQEYRSAYAAVAYLPIFTPFVHALVSDMEFTLDESLQGLQKLHDHEHKIQSLSPSAGPSEQAASSPARNRQPDNQPPNAEGGAAAETTEVNEETLRGQISSWMRLATDNLHLMNYLSEDSPDAFLTEEMIDRIASVLNYFLDRLVGQQCARLKVRNMEDLHFKPRFLLTELVDCYSHFAAVPAFFDAVVRDGRSYRNANFERAAQILGRAEMSKIASRLREVEQASKDEEEELGDVPDEFLDPLLYTLMRDPVKLPSGHSVDRASILRHILSDPIDPFSRIPITAEMLVPDVELKKQIDDWLLSRKRT